MCVFRCLIKGFSLLSYEWEITPFSKTVLLQRKPFLTILYIYNVLSNSKTMCITYIFETTGFCSFCNFKTTYLKDRLWNGWRTHSKILDFENTHDKKTLKVLYVKSLLRLKTLIFCREFLKYYFVYYKIVRYENNVHSQCSQILYKRSSLLKITKESWKGFVL